MDLVGDRRRGARSPAHADHVEPEGPREARDLEPDRTEAEDEERLTVEIARRRLQVPRLPGMPALRVRTRGKPAGEGENPPDAGRGDRLGRRPRSGREAH